MYRSATVTLLLYSTDIPTLTMYCTRNVRTVGQFKLAVGHGNEYFCVLTYGTRYILYGTQK